MRVEMAAMKRDAEHYSRQVSYANDKKAFYEVEMVFLSEEDFTADMVSSFSLYPHVTHD